MRIDFQFTRDREAIRKILTDRECWRRMVNDGAPAILAMDALTASPQKQFVLVRRELQPVGLFVLFPIGSWAEIHCCFLPQVWGNCADITRAFLHWLWTGTRVQR